MFNLLILWQSINRHIFQSKIKLKFLGLLTLFPLFSIAPKSSAQEFDFLEILEIQNTTSQNITVNRHQSYGEAETAIPGMQLQEFGDNVTVPNQRRSHLSLTLFNARNPSDRINQTFVWMGNQNTPTEYEISCQIRVGTALVGFGPENAPCDRGFHISAFPNPTPPDLPSQSTNDSFYYCSVVSDSGTAWGFSYAENLSENPCAKAQEKCLEKNNGEPTCFVANLGKWNAQNQNLAASIVCDNNFIITRTGDGEKIAADTLPLLQEMGKAVNATSCIFHVYQADAIIVSPVNNQLSFIHVYQADDDGLAVDALVGDAVVISAARGNGLTVPKGYGYRQKKEGLVVLNCPQIFQRPEIQESLDPANWSPSREISVDPLIRDRLQLYQADFCRTTGRTIHLVPDRLSFIF